jgi:hypothetical protein
MLDPIREVHGSAMHLCHRSDPSYGLNLNHGSATQHLAKTNRNLLKIWCSDLLKGSISSANTVNIIASEISGLSASPGQFTKRKKVDLIGALSVALALPPSSFFSDLFA